MAQDEANTLYHTHTGENQDKHLEQKLKAEVKGGGQRNTE
jgi:hypothetical protein